MIPTTFRLPATLALLLAAGFAVSSCARTEPRTPRQPIVGIRLDPENPSLPLGTTAKVTAQGVKLDGSTVDLEDVIWGAGDPEVLVLDAEKSVVTVRGIRQGSTLLTASARGLTASTVVVVRPAVAISLAITPPEAKLATGGTLDLSATATFSDGTAHEVTNAADWSISDSTVAGVTSEGNGRGKVVGHKEGTATVHAVFGGLTADAKLTVNGTPIVRIDVLPPRATLPLGTAVPFTAVAVFGDGTTSDVTTSATWVSSDSAVASVDPGTGLVHAVAKGDAAITAKYQGKEGSGVASVTTLKLKAVEVSPALVKLAKGTTTQLKATAVFEDDSRQDATLQATWLSADRNVAVLSSTVKGAFTAAGVGNTVITAQLLGQTGSAQVTVTAATLVSLAVTPATATLPKGARAALTATGTYSDGTSQDVTSQALWTSSDPTLAAVSNSPGSRGELTAVAPGLVTVTASLEGQTAQMSATVTAAALQKIEVLPAAPTLAKGTELQLSATATFSDGSTLDITSQAAWSSSDNATASVSTVGTTRGSLSGVRAGTAVITAAFNGKTGTAKVTVTPATLKTLVIAPLDPSLAKGTQLSMQATGTYSDGTVQDVTALATWSIGDTTLAGVSNAAGTNGRITALAEGKTTVAATLSGITVKTSLTITAAQLVSFKVSPATLILEYKTSQRLTATATYSDGLVQDVTDQTAWQSADPSVATVTSTGTRGTVASVREGRTTVTGSFGGKSGLCDVTVNAPKLVKLAVVPDTVSLPAGTQTQLRAVGTFADGSQQDLTQNVNWISSSASVAVGNAAKGGQISALSQGTADITITLDSVSAKATVTVTAPLADSLTISPSAARLAAGLKQAFTVRAFYSDGTSQDVTASCSFTSSDTTIVGMTGNVAVGVKAGGPITVTAKLGAMSATAQVTVTDPVLVSITLSTNGLVMAKDTDATIRATGVYSDGSSRDITAEAGWSSSIPSIATVSSGAVHGVAPGKTVVTASKDGVSTSVTVEVQAPTLQKVVLSPPNAVLRPNLIYPFKSYALYSDGTTKDVTTAATWTSANPSIAEPLNYMGYFGVWAKGVGVTTVKSTYSAVEGSTQVSVSNGTLTEVQISPARLSLPVGVAAKLAGVYAYSDGFAVEIQNPNWSSANPSVLRIDANGVVTALAQGTADIRMQAFSPAGGSYSANATITVTAAKIQSIQLTAPSTMVVGLASKVKATGTFSDGSIVDLGPSPVWSTSDTSLATVVPSSDGAKVTASAAGAVTLSASFDGVVASMPVKLTQATLTTLTMTAPQTTLPIGSASPITVKGTFSDGTTLDLTESVTYDSTDPSIAQAQNGQYTNAEGTWAIAQSLGAATIRATLSGKSASLPVKVIGPTLSKVELAVGSGPVSLNLNVSKNTQTQLRAVGTFSDGSTADVTIFCTFQPAKLGPGVVATVSNVIMGLVTPITTGSETVVVTYPPNYIGQPTVVGKAILNVQ